VVTNRTRWLPVKKAKSWAPGEGDGTGEARGGESRIVGLWGKGAKKKCVDKADGRTSGHIKGVPGVPEGGGRSTRWAAFVAKKGTSTKLETH